MEIVKCGNKGGVLFAPDSVPFVFSALHSHVDIKIG